MQTIGLEEHKGKRSLGRSRRREKGNIRIDLREVGGGGCVDCMHLPQAGSSRHGNKPLGSIKGGVFVY